MSHLDSATGVHPGGPNGSAIGRILSAGQSAMEEALAKQKSFWKYMGILTIIAICLDLCIILGAVMFEMMAATGGHSRTQSGIAQKAPQGRGFSFGRFTGRLVDDHTGDQGRYRAVIDGLVRYHAGAVLRGP